MSDMFINLVVVLVLFRCAQRIHGEPTTLKANNYSSSNVSHLSNGIHLPVRSADSQTYDNGGTTGNRTVPEMQWYSRLYDQHQWWERLASLEDQSCRRDMEIYVKQLLNGTIWAVKMYDASGRYDGLFFFGNVYWLGSSALCHELQNENIYAEVPPFPVYFYVAKIQIHINSKLTPVSRLMHLGLCLPKACDIIDVKKLLVQEANRAPASMKIVDVRPVPGNYSLFQDSKFQIIGISGLITLLFIIVASVVEVIIKKKRNKLFPKDAEAEMNQTAEHSNSTEKIIIKGEEIMKKKHSVLLKLLLAFSAITNGRKILSVDTVSKDAIGCLHGLRVFSIGWIILVHTYLEVFGVGKNKNTRTVTERNFMYQTISNATFSVDTFFFISGLLVTLGFFKNETAKEKNTNKESLGQTVFSSFFQLVYMITYRFIRLTPAYLFVLGINEVVIRYFHSTSVFTPAIIDQITCDKYWWRNALYINNFFPQAEFCMLWSWYIANDTQFFVIASILLLIAIRGNRHLKYVAISICVILLSSWVVTFVLAMQHNYVARVQEPFALFDELYDKPWMRIGPYLIGMVIGYMMFKVKNQLMFTPAVVVLGWMLSLTCLGSLVYGLGKHGLVVPASAFYAALGHTAWGLSLAWITVACWSGYGGPFNTLFSCKLFLPLSRLTYGAYLVHPILMYLTSFVLDGSLQIHNMLMIVIFFGNFVLSFTCAFIISVGFEAPSINLIKIFF